MAQRAVFLDRDNTIIADPGYINDPDAVQLLPGAAGAIRKLNDAGYTVVVVTNQSGIARGKITEQQLASVHERLRDMLSEQGARLDAIYHCPYLAGVDATVPRFRKDSELRKPKPGMLLRAAKEMELSLPASWMIGDSGHDVVAGRRAGCRTVQVGANGTATKADEVQPDFRANSLADAVEIVLRRPNPEPVATAPGADEATPESGSVTESPAQAASDDVGGTLGEIRDLLRKFERQKRQDDFSVARLVATLAQMLAVAAGCWGVVLLTGGNASASGWLLVAVLLQLFVLSAMAFGRR
ncbi:MAG: HAD family hydrolase [Phycisphaerales bacterium]|nr:HAD family hydrolase [Phycisphaerales bacterium]